jgi:hypothetical protein
VRSCALRRCALPLSVHHSAAAVAHAAHGSSLLQPNCTSHSVLILAYAA